MVTSCCVKSESAYCAEDGLYYAHNKICVKRKLAFSPGEKKPAMCAGFGWGGDLLEVFTFEDDYPADIAVAVYGYELLGP